MTKHDTAALIAAIRGNDSDFYRARWGTKKALEALPEISREEFVRTPLSRRRYKRERALVKIVHDAQGPFLSEWSFSDIGLEEYGVPSQRPFVYMSDPYEAIEKSMWCYERGMVPLVGEKDPDVAMFAAGKYEVDSLITDAAALAKLQPYFESHPPLAAISIIGDEFDAAALAPYAKYAETVRLVLALPETGAFAEAPLSPNPNFRALPGCIVEAEHETLVVTKERLLVTPAIRYRSGIPSDLYAGA